MNYQESNISLQLGILIPKIYLWNKKIESLWFKTMCSIFDNIFFQ